MNKLSTVHTVIVRPYVLFRHFYTKGFMNKRSPVTVRNVLKER